MDRTSFDAAEARRKRTKLFAPPVKEVCIGRPSPIRPTTPFSNHDSMTQDGQLCDQSGEPKYSRSQLLRLYAERSEAVNAQRAKVEYLRQLKKQLETAEIRQ
jgi:hypothetical protein